MNISPCSNSSRFYNKNRILRIKKWKQIISNLRCFLFCHNSSNGIINMSPCSISSYCLIELLIVLHMSLIKIIRNDITIHLVHIKNKNKTIQFKEKGKRIRYFYFPMRKYKEKEDRCKIIKKSSFFNPSLWIRECFFFFYSSSYSVDAFSSFSSRSSSVHLPSWALWSFQAPLVSLMSLLSEAIKAALSALGVRGGWRHLLSYYSVHKRAIFWRWVAFLTVFVIKFWIFGLFWWKMCNLCLIFRFFYQKNENLISFLFFFSILVKSFCILAFFWLFKWILDWFWEFFQYFDDCVGYSLGFLGCLVFA